MASLTHPSYFLQLLDEARANFITHLPYRAGGTVVCLGAGWGTIALACSRQFDHVMAVDATRENLQVIAHRAREAGQSNISLIRVDPFESARLPFADGVLSTVIVSHVLEWIGVGSSEADPQELQIKLLRDVHRVLEPGGHICLAIENRYYAGYWFGRREPHAKLPLVPILPRRMAGKFSRLVAGRPFRNYTPSYAGLRSLLHAAGFVPQRCYLRLPARAQATALIPDDSREALQHWARHVFVARRPMHHVYLCAARVLGRLGLLKQLAPEFVMIAEAQKAGASSVGESAHGFTVAAPRVTSSSCVTVPQGAFSSEGAAHRQLQQAK